MWCVSMGMMGSARSSGWIPCVRAWQVANDVLVKHPYSKEYDQERKRGIEMMQKRTRAELDQENAVCAWRGMKEGGAVCRGPATVCRSGPQRASSQRGTPMCREQWLSPGATQTAERNGCHLVQPRQQRAIAVTWCNPDGYPSLPHHLLSMQVVERMVLLVWSLPCTMTHLFVLWHAQRCSALQQRM